MKKTAFTIQGLAGEQDDLLGIWHQDQEADSGLAFDDPEFDETIVWSVTLQKGEDISSQKQTLENRSQQILEAGQSLQQIVSASETVSFTPDESMSEAEITLYQRLSMLQGEEISFDHSSVDDSWTQTIAGFQEFMHQTAQLLKPKIRIETQLERCWIAETRISTNGHFETRWQHRPTKTERSLHQEVVSLALESRLAWLQLLAQIGMGAVILATRFQLPGGAILALPAAWEYLRDVIRQAKRVAEKTEMLD